MAKPKCGHDESTCHEDTCLRDEGAHNPTPEEIQIEKDHLAQLDHARAMYYMAVQAAETELDEAIEKAGEIYEARLRQARHKAHRAEWGSKDLEWAPESKIVTT